FSCGKEVVAKDKRRASSKTLANVGQWQYRKRHAALRSNPRLGDDALGTSSRAVNCVSTAERSCGAVHLWSVRGRAWILKNKDGESFRSLFLRISSAV